MAIVTAVKKWRPYLVGKPCIINQSLKFFLEQTEGWHTCTTAQQKWITKLLRYSFLVEYKQGRENKAADDIDRRLEDSDSLTTDSGASFF